MELARFYLCTQEQDQRRSEDHRAYEVAKPQGHRHGVTTDLAERGRKNLDDPEAERDFRNLAQHLIACLFHAVASHMPIPENVQRRGNPKLPPSTAKVRPP